MYIQLSIISARAIHRVGYNDFDNLVLLNRFQKTWDSRSIPGQGGQEDFLSDITGFPDDDLINIFTV
jgi:hypothetical protein